jgi:GR25 family glycosyltransferase involved in LPS biosynthesis
LVIEDDVAIDPRFAEVVAFAAGVAGTGDYVRFPRWERGEDGETVNRAGDMAVIEPFLPALGMQAELIGREAARLLLAATETFDRPVDSIVQMQWLHGARVLSARPIVVREIDRELGGTVLQNKKLSFLEWMAHEVRRPLSRAAIVRHNRRWRKS